MKKILVYLLMTVFCVSCYFAGFFGERLLRAKREVDMPVMAYYEHYVKHQPYIEGPDDFKQQVNEALALIKEKSPQQYEEICDNAVRIKWVDYKRTKSGVAWANQKYMEIYIVDVLFESTHPYALQVTLVHEAKHLTQNPAYTNAEQREREAVLAERTLLVALGVDEATIEQLTGEQRFASKWWEEEKLVQASQ